jgi:uncharacterized membrane protein
MMAEYFSRKVKTIFLAGLLIIVPVLITIILLVFLFNFFERILVRPVILLLHLIGLPKLSSYPIAGLLGLGLLMITSFILGLVVTNMVGRKVIALGEKILSKVPLVWNIYYASKQIMESTASMSKKAFQQIVLVEYPRLGSYTIGFITSDARGEIHDKIHRDVLNVYIPTPPNPITGMLVIVPREDIIPLSMSIEDGIKLIFSLGMVMPRYPGHFRKYLKEQTGTGSV